MNTFIKTNFIYVFLFPHFFTSSCAICHRKIYHLHNILLSGFNWHKIVNCKVKSTVTTDCSCSKDILVISHFYFWMNTIVSPSGIQTWDLMHATWQLRAFFLFFVFFSLSAFLQELGSLC